MKTLTIARPAPTDLTEGLHIANIESVENSKREWTFSLSVEEGGKTYSNELSFQEPIEADSPLLLLVAAAENKDMKPGELEGFDLDKLTKKRVVVVIVHKRAAGGSFKRAVALVLSIAQIKQFANTLTPDSTPTQPSTTP